MVTDPPTHPQTDRTDYDTLRRSFTSASMEKCMCVHVRCPIPYSANPLQCPHHHIQVAHYRSTLVYLPPANLRNSLICQISKEMNSGRLTKYYDKAVTVIRMMISLVYFSRDHSRLGLVPPPKRSSKGEPLLAQDYLQADGLLDFHLTVSKH